ncbi:MAG TPA: TerC/Alx family metal homeostasis membrane protein [Polyangia bacterium]|nr:TerC/Alx family metal homeostasis membrane protein [Polyangia bacterium]
MNSPYLWSGFIGLLLTLLALDLFLTGRRHGGVMPPRTALWWSAFWVALSIAFGLGLWVFAGGQRALEFFTGYLIEKSLSVDNLFIFLIIFGTFRVPEGERHRVLSWGVLGALALRAALILAGVNLVSRYDWVLYVFAALLAWTGVRVILQSEDKARASQSQERMAHVIERVLPVVWRYEGGRFFTREHGRRVCTLLFVVVLVVEGTDIVFAMDSIPAILAITQDPFIVFSSNMLALLGLRALFFAIADLLGRLRYLHYGLGALLLLIGAKLALREVVHIAPGWSFLMTLGVIGVAVAFSLLWPARGEGHGRAPTPPAHRPSRMRAT